LASRPPRPASSSSNDAPRYIAAVTLAAFAEGIGLLYLNFYFRALRLDDAAIGVLNAAPAIGLALAALPTFAFADRFPRKYVLLFGGSITVAASLGVIASSAFPALFLFATLAGAGAVMTDAAGLALLAEATDDRTRARTFGISFASVSFAGFIANVAGGSLAPPLAASLGRAEHDPLVLRVLLALAAVIGASSAIPVVLLRSRERPPHVPAPRQWRVLARFIVINVLFGFGAGNFLPFLNLFFADRYGLDFVAVGGALGLISIAGGLGALAHTRAAGRIGSEPALITIWSASLPFALLGAFAPTAVVAVTTLVARGVLMTAAQPTLDAYTMSSLRAQERAGAQAVLNTTWTIARGVGALASGAVRGALGPAGYSVNIVTLVASYAFAIAFFALAFRRR
jgi:predicted MFS family arabinose efflux permease